MTLLAARGLTMGERLLSTDRSFEGAQMIALVGPNGGGKTSFLRALAGAEEASGRVTIDGEDIALLGEARRRHLLAFLPASRDIAWPIAVRDVIALGLGARNDGRVAALIDLFELEDLAERPVSRLSTGERSRVLLARAMAQRPKMLLLDEPLANLEPYWVLRITAILRELANDGALVLVALHDLSQLGRFDRALLMAGGRVERDDTPDRLVASERFGAIFRITGTPDGWAIRPEDRQSSR